jgi:hypothetical protein
MAFTKAQLEALKNSLLASNQPINAATHRAFVQNIIDELYDAQSRGNLLAGVQANGTTAVGDQILVIRSGAAFLIPASLFGSGISFDDLNGIVIVDPQDGDLLVYDALTDTWGNLPNTFVPYAGATASVDLGEFGLRAGFVRFDTTPTGTPTDQGTVSWDVDNETLDVVLNGYTMKVGEDLFYPVKNQTGANIPKGTAVRFNGTVGASGRLLIAPYLADGSLPSTRFMGVTAEAIANGEDGKVLWFGRLRGINTNAFNEGDILYASTTVAGGYQTAVPTPPNNVISVAAVINKSINQGVLFVRPQIETQGDFVTVATAQNITGAKVFINQLLALSGSNPVFRIATSDNTSTLNFRNAANEDAASISMSTPANEVALATAVNNMNIRIQPHGTGGVRFPAVPAAAGAVRMMVLDSNDRLRDGGVPLNQKIFVNPNTAIIGTTPSVTTAGTYAYSYSAIIPGFASLNLLPVGTLLEFEFGMEVNCTVANISGDMDLNIALRFGNFLLSTPISTLALSTNTGVTVHTSRASFIINSANNFSMQINQKARRDASPAYDRDRTNLSLQTGISGTDVSMSLVFGQSNANNYLKINHGFLRITLP